MKKRLVRKSKSSKSNMSEIEDKKAQMNAFWWIIIFIGIIFVIYLVFAISNNQINFKDFFSLEVKTIPEIVGGFSGSNVALTQVVSIFNWIIGPVSVTTINLSGSEISALIITVAIWIMILLMFGDILSTLSFFSKGVSWALAILLTIVLANLKFAVLIAAGMTAIFGTFGVIAAYLGLAASFIAFLGVDWGVKSMMPWIMRRKSAIGAVRSKATTEQIKAAIGHYKEIGETLSK